MTTREQVHEALDVFLETHETAQAAAAAWFDLKRKVGSNETERKIAQKDTPADEYAGYVAMLVDAERVKSDTAAVCERAEKILNTLREVLQDETADTNRATAEIAARTAERYATIGMTPPARPMIRPVITDEPPF